MIADRPGYDALAEKYAETFPEPFQTAIERRAVDAFADLVQASGLEPGVVDVGCGTGGVAAHLARRGLSVHGVDPSTGMLAVARREHPELTVTEGDARLTGVDLSKVGGVIARHSLIHVPPDEVRAVLVDWSARLPTGAVVLVSAQAADEPGVHEFDHAVTRAWRWHPDALGAAVVAAGFDELWRTVSRADADHRFPDVHLVARCR
ncbi:class I SAM-dependent methyltransferase [Gordonia neofelifaecis]|uniref:Type 11 methyltransferase n=1 Tax=Gordonia neofelifaecis NRRL B-59395 TaxID=644548 RepID=F1YP83_9ACTN|nr:class I SAM-dependent methyltransferase [Gordonia neofelifaecis]EGD53478.1 type 11 methyltransferase [Gordonia neofelifaecis NRRL B-59395]